MAPKADPSDWQYIYGDWKETHKVADKNGRFFIKSIVGGLEGSGAISKIDADKIKQQIKSKNFQAAQWEVSDHINTQWSEHSDGIFEATLNTTVAGANSQADTLKKLIGDSPEKLIASNPLAVKYARSSTGNLIKNINKSQLKTVRSIIEKASNGKLSPNETVNEIKQFIGLTPLQSASLEKYRGKLFEKGLSAGKVEKLFNKKRKQVLAGRADMIAVTESMRAANRGQQLLWDQAIENKTLNPSEFQKRWIVTPDDRLCPKCNSMGQQRIEVQGNFEGESGEGVMPSPPLHPLCRCAVGLERRTSKAAVTDPGVVSEQKNTANLAAAKKSNTFKKKKAKAVQSVEKSAAKAEIKSKKPLSVFERKAKDVATEISGEGVLGGAFSKIDAKVFEKFKIESDAFVNAKAFSGATDKAGNKISSNLMGLFDPETRDAVEKSMKAFWDESNAEYLSEWQKVFTKSQLMDMTPAEVISKVKRGLLVKKAESFVWKNMPNKGLPDFISSLRVKKLSDLMATQQGHGVLLDDVFKNLWSIHYQVPEFSDAAVQLLKAKSLKSLDNLSPEIKPKKASPLPTKKLELKSDIPGKTESENIIEKYPYGSPPGGHKGTKAALEVELDAVFGMGDEFAPHKFSNIGKGFDSSLEYYNGLNWEKMSSGLTSGEVASLGIVRKLASNQNLFLPESVLLRIAKMHNRSVPGSVSWGWLDDGYMRLIKDVDESGFYDVPWTGKTTLSQQWTGSKNSWYAATNRVDEYAHLANKKIEQRWFVAKETLLQGREYKPPPEFYSIQWASKEASITNAVDGDFQFWDSKTIRRQSDVHKEKMTAKYSPYIQKVENSADGSRVMGSVKEYTGAAFGNWNRELRLHPTVLDRDAKNVQRFLLDAPKPPDDLVVWRNSEFAGTLVRGKDMEERLASAAPDSLMRKYNLMRNDEVLPGDVLQLNGFQSSGLDYNTFAKGADSPEFKEAGFSHEFPLMEIHPSYGAYVNDISENRGEDEFLMPHGQEFRVANVTTRLFMMWVRDDAGKLVQKAKRRRVIQLVPTGKAPIEP